MNNNQEKNHTFSKELASRLQFEVDSILQNIDDEALYSEFKSAEIIDARNDQGDEMVYQTIDDRIEARLANRKGDMRQQKLVEWQKKLPSRSKVYQNAHKTFSFLFKRFEL